MPKFGKASLKRLSTLHPDLQKILNELIKYFDFSIIAGHRGEEEQNRAYDSAYSTKKWANSKHNKQPSDAVDIAPFPIDWSKRGRFLLLIGAALCIARQMKANGEITSDIRSGADWNRNNDPDDEMFIDLPHLERI
jgi:peptidoglycan L-alanyl-D-glutamate endopeptidase CwlK